MTSTVPTPITIPGWTSPATPLREGLDQELLLRAYKYSERAHAGQQVHNAHPVQHRHQPNLIAQQTRGGLPAQHCQRADRTIGTEDSPAIMIGHTLLEQRIDADEQSHDRHALQQLEQ